MINSFLHWLSHLFNNNNGKVVTFEEDGFICVGFLCDYCKQIDANSIVKIESEKVYGKRDSDSWSE